MFASARAAVPRPAGKPIATAGAAPVSGHAPSIGCAYRLPSSGAAAPPPSPLLLALAPTGGMGACSCWHACCSVAAASSGSRGMNMCRESAAAQGGVQLAMYLFRMLGPDGRASWPPDRQGKGGGRHACTLWDAPLVAPHTARACSHVSHQSSTARATRPRAPPAFGRPPLPLALARLTLNSLRHVFAIPPHLVDEFRSDVPRPAPARQAGTAAQRWGTHEGLACAPRHTPPCMPAHRQGPGRRPAAPAAAAGGRASARRAEAAQG